MPWSFEDLRSILMHQLNAPLENEVQRFAEISRFSIEQVQQYLDFCPGQTFAEALEKPVSPEILEMIKEYAKASLMGDLDLPRDVARVIYIASIQQAQKAGFDQISTLDSASIQREIRRCLTFAWLTNEIRQILRK